MSVKAVPAELLAVSDGDHAGLPHVVLYVAVGNNATALALSRTDAVALQAALALLLTPKE